MKKPNIKSIAKLVACHLGMAKQVNELPPVMENIGHGYVDLVNPVTHRAIRIYGGSYFKRPPTLTGVLLAEELNLPNDFHFPIPDFGTPSLDVLLMGVDDILTLALKHEQLYVGCYGGYGRTGLMIAALMICYEGRGAKEAVERVRQYIHPSCVETRGQLEALRTLDLEVSTETFEGAVAFARLNKCS